MKVLSLLLIPFLIHILFTDLKWRKVNSIVLLVLTALSVLRIFTGDEIQGMMVMIVLNLIITLLLTTVLVLYARLRKIKFFQSFGLGDLLFFVICAINFAPVSYLIFIGAGSAIGLVYFTLRKDKTNKHIPFAGLMAGLLSIVILIDVVSTYSTYNDLYFIQLTQ